MKQKVKSTPNSCGSSNNLEVENSPIECNGKFISSKCVIEESILGDFVGGNQSKLNEYIFKHFTEVINKLKQEVITFSPDSITEPSFLMNTGEVLLKEQLVNMLKNTSSIITNIDNSSIGDSTLFKDFMEITLDFDRNKFDDFNNNSKNITFIGTGNNNAPIGNFTFKKSNSSELIYGESITINGENKEVTFEGPHTGPVIFNIFYNGDKDISVTKLTGF